MFWSMMILLASTLPLLNSVLYLGNPGKKKCFPALSGTQSTDLYLTLILSVFLSVCLSVSKIWSTFLCVRSGHTEKGPRVREADEQQRSNLSCYFSSQMTISGILQCSTVISIYYIRIDNFISTIPADKIS